MTTIEWLIIIKSNKAKNITKKSTFKMENGIKESDIKAAVKAKVTSKLKWSLETITEEKANKKNNRHAGLIYSLTNNIV